jgi:alpha-tubulin suppressor-like RCC1 family protein
VVASLPAAATVTAGGAHSCAALTDGRVFCWGANDQGQLGDGDNVPSLVPVPVPALTAVVQVAAGRAHTCARQRDGAVWCWGGNDSGQLGDGRALQKTTPQLGRMTCD